MRHIVLILLFATSLFCSEQTVTVTVVSSETVRRDTGYSATNASGSCVGDNCTANSSTVNTQIPVRYLYVEMGGKRIRLHAKQQFLTSYGKTLPPGDYQGEWKNNHTLTIHYTDKGKAKTADYELAGVW